MRILRVLCSTVVSVVLLLGCGCKTDYEEDKPEIHIGLLSPQNGTEIDQVVTFQWYIGKGVGEKSYDAFVFTDKGVNPFDGQCENVFHAGKNAMELTIDLFRSGWYYHGTSFEWGVLVVTSTGREYRSEVWEAHIR